MIPQETTSRKNVLKILKKYFFSSRIPGFAKTGENAKTQTQEGGALPLVTNPVLPTRTSKQHNTTLHYTNNSNQTHNNTTHNVVHSVTSWESLTWFGGGSYV